VAVAAVAVTVIDIFEPASTGGVLDTNAARFIFDSPSCGNFG
jgi:hypothetical protein